MPNLLEAYDSYSDFHRSSYFIICYDTLPSNLKFETPLKATKEAMEAVMASFNYEDLQLKEVVKNWNTADDKNADSSNDYPDQYLLKSESKKLVIWISLVSNELTVDFLYDVADAALEQEVISMNKMLRAKFGVNKSPTFKVLSHNSRHFYTEDVRTDELQLNLDELYNDDFLEINAIIEEALNREVAGLILLHGAPGTGKTSYIKSLISRFQTKDFIFVQNEFIKDLLNPDFISFLLQNRNSILIIEDAEKVITSRESLSENSVVSTILQLTDGLFSDYLNIKIICTFNTSIARVDKALLRKGRMIANYEFKPLTKEKSNKLLEAMGYQADGKDMALADIFNFEKRGFDTNGGVKKIGFGV
ncbi:AAA family ATPase [Botryobacter ruber]|uniref:AAA family ATPase n=1 Tax=Botryobacter ruber TaxID=2171629 RepID=UPI000E0C9558|nr:AAA family ATPase [Botryobacter ruber]